MSTNLDKLEWKITVVRRNLIILVNIIYKIFFEKFLDVLDFSLLV